MYKLLYVCIYVLYVYIVCIYEMFILSDHEMIEQLFSHNKQVVDVDMNVFKD